MATKTLKMDWGECITQEDLLFFSECETHDFILVEEHEGNKLFACDECGLIEEELATPS